MNLSADRRLTVAWIVVVALTLAYLVIDRAVGAEGLEPPTPSL